MTSDQAAMAPLAQRRHQASTQGAASSGWATTGLGRASRLAVALVAAGALATGCTRSLSVSGHPQATSYQQNLAYAHCMRAHGLTSFPNPTPSATFNVRGPQVGNRNSPEARANDACKRLLPAVNDGYRPPAPLGDGLA